MNKSDFISKVAEGSDLSKADAEKALSSITDVIKEALQSGDKVTLVGFGTFSAANRAARTGRNPQTGAEIKIPAKNVVKFKAGKGLVDALNG